MKRLNDLESYWMPFTANRDFKKIREWWFQLMACIIRVKLVKI